MDGARGGHGGIVVNIASILGLFCAQQPKGWLLATQCLHWGPLFIVAGYQYNVSKSAVVTLTRCIGNEVVSSVTSTGDHLGAVVTVLSNHSIVIGFNSCLATAS